MQDLREDSLWNAVAHRDAAYDGVFYFGVKTTGVYCRPGCPSRQPKRENVVFAFSPAMLAAKGYRPCRRCRPDARDPRDEAAGTVVALCRAIEEAEHPLSLEDVARVASMSGSAVTRLFREALGVTPKGYADSHRVERFRETLRGGAGVLDATYASGYGSSSRVYESANGCLGMTPKSYRERGRGQRVAYTVTETAMGWLLVAATDRGVSAVKLGDDAALLVDELGREFSAADLSGDDGPLAAWTKLLVEYLSGHVPWPQLPYDVRATAFQRRVWEFLRRIPVGETMHYSDVAEALGQPTATRAVARACATNPVALVVPCHRVVPKGPGFAGFRWGIERKRKLLQLEGSPEANR
ncbi:MAG: methylated-DNA--[protein]-cysteine S-methyltransferase [Dehalococcoidia bacterium]|jgi:AraC family transcriptional regulator of adaptative response/methylated-DNA-[protein]-cysteine methyltransferase|nr:methylated-DNA--[protein]-cysteine S-methyltransferase [Dehalococcoidia bacterium]